jgi:hypothetical protein
MATKELVKLKVLRRRIKVTRVTHPRLDTLKTAATRLGIAQRDADGDLAVTADQAEILKSNYESSGFFGRREFLVPNPQN